MIKQTDTTKQRSPQVRELIDYRELQDKEAHYFTITLPGTVAAVSSSNYMFTARHPIEILRVTEIHEALGTFSPTLDIVKTTSGVAPSAGTSILVALFDLGSANDTPVIKEGVALNNNRRLKENESLAILSAGTLSGLRGICVTVYYQNYAMGSYK